MKSNVNINRHPVHPYLVLFVAGLFAGSLVFDLVYLSTRNPDWRFAAFWTIVFGIVMGLIAASVGLIDLFTLRMQARPRGIGWTHGLLNLGIVTLYIINLIIRGHPGGAAFGNPLAWTITLNVIAVAALLVSAWLGQVLVYIWGIGVPVRTMERIPPVAAPAPTWVTPQVAGSKAGEYPAEEEDPEDIQRRRLEQQERNRDRDR